MSINKINWNNLKNVNIIKLSSFNSIVLSTFLLTTSLIANNDNIDNTDDFFNTHTSLFGDDGFEEHEIKTKYDLNYDGNIFNKESALGSSTNFSPENISKKELIELITLQSNIDDRHIVVNSGIALVKNHDISVTIDGNGFNSIKDNNMFGIPFKIEMINDNHLSTIDKLDKMFSRITSGYSDRLKSNLFISNRLFETLKDNNSIISIDNEGNTTIIETSNLNSGELIFDNQVFQDSYEENPQKFIKKFLLKSGEELNSNNNYKSIYTNPIVYNLLLSKLNNNKDKTEVFIENVLEVSSLPKSFNYFNLEKSLKTSLLKKHPNLISKIIEDKNNIFEGKKVNLSQLSI